MKKILYITLCLLVLLSCEKEVIPELVDQQKNTSTPESTFYLKGLLGTDSVNIKSSQNYYMFSDFEFDVAKDLFVFTGELKETNCANCGIAIKIKLNNYIASPGEVVNFDLDTVFKLEDKSWNDPLFPSDFLNKVEMIVNYNNGEPLRSSYSISQSSNSFKVVSAEHYENNELGQSTVKVKFEGRVLIPTSTPAAKLFIFEGVYAFAHPN